MIKIICNRCNKLIESIDKVGFIQFCYQNPFESVMDDNISDRNHYCEDCMTEIEQFVQNDGSRVVNKVENMEKALNDALQEVREMSGVINVPVLNIPQIDIPKINLPKIPVLAPGNAKKQETPPLREKDFKSEPRTSRYRIDYAKIMSLKESGMKNKDIAAQMGMTSQEVATAVYTYKKRNGMETGSKESTKLKSEPKKLEKSQEQEKKVDVGKIGALYKAGWSVPKIMDEMDLTESEVLDVVNKIMNLEMKEFKL